MSHSEGVLPSLFIYKKHIYAEHFMLEPEHLNSIEEHGKDLLTRLNELRGYLWLYRKTGKTA